MTPASAASRRQPVVLVAAVAKNGVIGAGGQLPWHLPGDLAHFRRVTEGNVVVMGRRTYDAIGRPLPRRTNVVVTRQTDWNADGVLVARSWDEARRVAGAHEGLIMVIGGGEIYALALPDAELQIITEVHQEPLGDAHYPPFDPADWAETRREPQDGYDFVWLERRRR